MPGSPGPYLLGFVSIVAAVSLNFLASSHQSVVLLGARNPRFLDAVHGPDEPAVRVPGARDLVPDWLLDFARATPFPSMLQTPVDILAGRTVGAESLAMVGLQLLWLAVLLGGVVQVMVRFGSRRLVVQGG